MSDSDSDSSSDSGSDSSYSNANSMSLGSGFASSISVPDSSSNYSGTSNNDSANASRHYNDGADPLEGATPETKKFLAGSLQQKEPIISPNVSKGLKLLSTGSMLAGQPQVAAGASLLNLVADGVNFIGGLFGPSSPKVTTDEPEKTPSFTGSFIGSSNNSDNMGLTSYAKKPIVQTVVKKTAAVKTSAPAINISSQAKAQEIIPVATVQGQNIVTGSTMLDAEPVSQQQVSLAPFLMAGALAYFGSK